MATEYVYEDCTVTKIVDGDTIDADIRKKYDMGFKVVIEGQTKQRLRLMGINTPELRPRKAKEGKEFDGIKYYDTQEQKEAITLEAKKARAHVIELCLNKKVKVVTYKSDSFGRYLADVYIITDAGEIHLNQDLLDRGLAEVYKI